MAYGSQDIHVHVYIDQSALARIEAKLDRILKGETHMSQELDNLKAAVESENTVIASAETLLTELHDMLVANANDPVAIQAIADEVAARSGELAAAVTANTPPAPPAP